MEASGKADVIGTALVCFGIEAQRIKCIEEMAELTKELCKDAIGKGDRDHIAEEIADVKIMLMQMERHYCVGAEVGRWEAKKLKRLVERLNMMKEENEEWTFG